MVPQSSGPREPLRDAREESEANSAALGGAGQGERIQASLPPGPRPGLSSEGCTPTAWEEVGVPGVVREPEL